MTLLVWFLVGMIATLLNGYISRWVATYFVNQKSTSIAGFSFAFGAMGTISGMSSTFEAVRNATGIGASVGMVLLWYLFFKLSERNAEAEKAAS